MTLAGLPLPGARAKSKNHCRQRWRGNDAHAKLQELYRPLFGTSYVSIRMQQCIVVIVVIVVVVFLLSSSSWWWSWSSWSWSSWLCLWSWCGRDGHQRRHHRCPVVLVARSLSWLLLWSLFRWWFGGLWLLQWSWRSVGVVAVVARRSSISETNHR